MRAGFAFVDTVIGRICHKLAAPLLVLSVAAAFLTVPAMAGGFPWANKDLSADRRADLLLAQMTMDEKLQLVHGHGWGALKDEPQPGSNGGAGFVRGIPRLGIPNVDMDDAAIGARLSAYNGRYSTALPSVLALASSWNPETAYLYGQLIGRELRAQGFNAALGGGVNLARDPRAGRGFEYAGEDPLLAGTIVGRLVKGVQSQHVMSTIKHYALNDQETLRGSANVVIDEKAMRESDLMAFQIALKQAEPGAVMCAYNKVNGDYACENDFLLNKVLKRDFGFKGFVMSDWSATHSTVKAALAGLDQEQPDSPYFGTALKDAIAKGDVPPARLNDMVHRILRSMFASGLFDYPVKRSVVDPFRGRREAQTIAEQSFVLLKNTNYILPFKSDIASVAVIGGHADAGVLGGSGSAIVDPPGGDVVPVDPKVPDWLRPVYYPSAPLQFIRARAPNARIEFADGQNIEAAAKLAAKATVAVVFVTQHMAEGHDAENLSLPGNQDALVAAVAAANPHTIVVIESGGPVTMPWLDQVDAVLEVWYPGIGGGEAIAATLFGDVAPSGRLPVTFPVSDADLPHPTIPGIGLAKKSEIDIPYTEGALVGYKWFASEQKPVQFAFGYGLTYTTFAYADLHIDTKSSSVRVTLRNIGPRTGTDVAQVYAVLPGDPQYPRLVAWSRVTLAPGESRTLLMPIDPLVLSRYDLSDNAWHIARGTIHFAAGPSFGFLPLQADATLRQR